jgi:hypothetical protein
LILKIMIEIESVNIVKKEWNAPTLISLDFKNTEGGKAIGTADDGTYHPDSSTGGNV